MQMKRYLSLLLSLVMIASILPTYSINAFALDCRHDRTCVSVTLPAGCTSVGYTVNASADGKMGYCTQCGKFVSKRINTYRAYDSIPEYRTNNGDVTVLEPTGHVFDGELTEEANCTYYAQRRCSVGNPTYSSVRNPETLKFEFVVTDGTCTEIGYSTAAEDAPNGEHMYMPSDSTEPTCTEAGFDLAVCYYCGDAEETPLPALGHDYSDLVQGISPTCTDDGYDVYACSRCGDEQMTEYPALGHDFTVLVSETEPTCTTGGSATFKCSRCDETETKEIKPLGHKFSDWTVVTPASCTTGGKEQRVCETCAEIDSRELEALGHTYVVTASVEPTCTTGGSKEYTCAVCGDMYTENLDALGHEYASDWTLVKAPTCTEKGIEAKGCIHLGCSEQETREVKELGHEFGATETVAPTCTEQGYTVYACSRCPETYNDDFTPALGHDWEEVTLIEPDCTEPGKKGERCTRCLAENPEAEAVIPAAHKYVLNTEKSTAASCGVAGAEVYTCSVCGDEYSVEIPALEHNYVKDEAMSTEPSCTENGCVAFRCTICDDVKLDIIEATGHDLVPMGFHYKAPTCTEDGYKYEVCRNCKRIVNTVLPALGHEYAVAQHNAPTCTEKGYDTYVCSRCNNGYEKELPALGHDYVLNEETAVEFSCTTGEYKEYNCSRCGDSYTVTNPPVNHMLYLDAEDDLKPTCTEDGYQLWRCLNCAEVFRENVPALGHNYKLDESLGIAATCTEDGRVAYVCNNCNDTKYEIIAALGHDYQPNEELSIGATCTEAGYVVFTCTHCGDSYDLDGVALGHNAGEAVFENLTNCAVVDGEIVSTSCTEQGSYDKVTYCTRCGVETSHETFTVEAKGHRMTHDAVQSWVAGHMDFSTGIPQYTGGHWENIYPDDVEPTCGATGYECWKCADCDYEQHVVIPATGDHDFQFVSTTATCATDGEALYSCSRCGATRTEAAPASPEYHNFVVEESESWAANCDSTGRITSHCEYCGELKEVTLPKLQHNWVKYTKPATCTEGCTYEYCTNCYKRRNEQVLAPTIEHDMPGYDVFPATCTKDGSKEGYCVRCGENVKITLPALGHDYRKTMVKSATLGYSGYYDYECSRCGGTKHEKIAGLRPITLSEIEYMYDGKAKKPTIIVRDGDGKIVPKKYYNSGYARNTNIGIATVWVNFNTTNQDRYAGYYEGAFKIYPAKATLKKLEKTKKATEIKVTWNAYDYPKTIDGFVVEYSKNSNFKDSTKKKVKKPKATTYTITGLKKNTKYYVRVCPYKNIKKVNYMTASNVKSIKTSK